MPRFYCECCKFETDRKSTYDNHMKSDKHKRRENGGSDTNSIITNSVITNLDQISNISDSIVSQDTQRIHELEKLLLEKENENKLQAQEIKHKDLIIDMLKQQIQQQQNQIQQIQQQQIQQQQIQQIQQQYQHGQMFLTIKEKPKPKPSFNKKEYLDITRKDAITIEEFLSNMYLGNPDYNPYITYVNNEIALKSYDRESYGNNITTNVNVLCKTLNNIDQNYSPIFCCDARRNKFCIKTIDGWVEDGAEIDKILKTITSNIVRVMAPCLNIEHIFRMFKQGGEYDWFMTASVKDRETFKSLCLTNIETYWEKGIKEKILSNSFFLCDDEDYIKFFSHAKASLSKICGLNKTEYKAEKVVPVEEEEEEEEKDEYDCEKDPNDEMYVK